MPPDYSQTYLYKIHKLTNVLDTLFDKVLQKHAGVSLAQFTLLLSVARQKTVNQASVATSLMLSRAAISRRVEIAQKQGWLKVTLSPISRREQVLEITAMGKGAVDRGLQALGQSVFGIFDDDQRRVSLMDHIDILLANAVAALAAEHK